jgi:hypothetical protein
MAGNVLLPITIWLCFVGFNVGVRIRSSMTLMLPDSIYVYFQYPTRSAMKNTTIDKHRFTDLQIK